MKKAFPYEKETIIIDILKNNSMSIAELLRKTGMKRATFIYYLAQLEEKGFIKKTRLENKKGRPTIIEFNQEGWDKRKKERNEEKVKQQKEYDNVFLSNPITKIVLRLIKENPNTDFRDLLNKKEIRDYVLKYQITNWLHQNKFIKESLNITKEGEKFLKENS